MARATLFRMFRSPSRNIVSSTNFIGSVQHCHRSVPWESNLGTKETFSSSFLISSQKRWTSQAAKTEDDSRISIGPQIRGQPTEGKKETGVVYYGPISSIIKKVKLLSLSTCCLSVSLGPVITFMTSTDSNVILKGAVASSVIFFSVPRLLPSTGLSAFTFTNSGGNLVQTALRWR